MVKHLCGKEVTLKDGTRVTLRELKKRDAGALVHDIAVMSKFYSPMEKPEEW